MECDPGERGPASREELGLEGSSVFAMVNARLAKDLQNEPTASCRCVKLRNEPKEGRFGTPLENTKRTQEVLLGGAARKYETNPRPRNSQRLERLDICTIFIRAVATGGKRSGDVTGNIGEIRSARDVTGCVATCQGRSRGFGRRC